MNRKMKRRLKPLYTSLRTCALITLSLLALLPSFTVKADEKEVFSNPYFAFEVDRNEVNTLKLIGETFDETTEIESVTLVSDNGTQITEKAIMDETGSYNLQFAIGKNGNYKLVIKYSLSMLEEAITVPYEIVYDTYQEVILQAPAENETTTLNDENSDGVDTETNEPEHVKEDEEQSLTVKIDSSETKDDEKLPDEVQEEKEIQVQLDEKTETDVEGDLLDPSDLVEGKDTNVDVLPEGTQDTGTEFVEEKEVIPEENKLSWMNMRTGEITYYSDEEIGVFNAQARASGVLTVPNKFQGEYRIDSYSGGWQGTKYSWGIAYINGDYAVCLDPTRQAGHGNSYLTDDFFFNLPESQQQTIWLINYFGIGFEGDTNYHRFLAQQELTWEQMTIQQVRGYGGDEKFGISWTGKNGEDIGLINQYKAEIQSLMSTYYTRPSFHNTTYDVKVGDTLTLTDTNNVLSRFRVTLPSGLELISNSGNTLQVRVTSKNVHGQEITLTKKHQLSATTTTAWGFGDAQKVFTAGDDRHDPLRSRAIVNIKAGNLDLGKSDVKNVMYAGVVFELSKDKSTIDQTVTTGANGRVLIEGLDEGTLYYREKNVVDPLVIDTTWKEVTIKAGETTVETAVNDIKPSLQLGKQDTKGNWIANTVFEYSYDKSTILGTATTGNDGKAPIINNLTAGFIYVREKNVPKPLIVDTEWKQVTLVNNETAVYTAVNNHAQWSYSILKLDEHGKPLAVTFDVYDGNNTHTGTISTGIDGKYTSGKLDFGSVILVEKNAPDGIVVDKTPIKLTGTYKDQHTEVFLVSKTITNKYRDFNVTLTKVEDTSDKFNPEYHGQTLEGVELAYYARTDIYEGTTLRYLAGELVGKLITNSAGQVTFHNLPAGGYRIEEVATIEGYQLHEGYWDMEVAYTGSDPTVSVVPVGKTLTNTPIYGGVELVKANGTVTERLEGAEFELYYKDKLLGTYTSDKDGRIVVNGLRYSTSNAYKFLETKSPWGYWLSEDPIYFDITDQGEMVYLIAPNNLIEVHIEGNKTNEDTIPLEGVGFSIRNFETKEIVVLKYADGREIKEESVFYTDENGDFFTRGMLTAGEYELIEVDPHEGYQPIDPIRFTVDAEQSYIDLGDLIGLSLDVGDIVNYWNRGDIEIGKLDPELNIYLPNFGFNLYDINNNLLGYYETDETGFVTIPNLKYGLYDVEEVKVNGEYLLNPNQTRERIFVEEHDTTYTVIFENVQPKGRLEGLKQDYKDATPVEGAEYGLFTLEDELVQSTLTDKDGKFEFEGFGLGKYYVQEIATVDGYRLDETKYFVDFEYIDEHTPIILQTLIIEEMRMPEIGTTASFVERDKQEPNIVTLVDKVAYENLVIGKEYTVNGLLKNPDTGLSILIDGKEVTATTTFIADKHDGFVEVFFTFDASKLETKKVVVFEDLLEEEIPISFHHDLKDIHQTVEIPEIGTSASFTKRDEIEPNIVTLTDEVRYSGLVIGKEYTVNGILMDKETGLPILIDGKEVTGTSTFTATTTDGIVNVEFVFDASKLETKVVVVFEDMYEEDRLIAVHHDLEDIEQTVEIPEIGTSLSYTERDKQEPNMVTLTDVVSYNGLVIGKEYTVTGVLMDFHTEKPILIDGKEVTASTSFIAESTSGTVNVEFVFDQNKLTTDRVVAFEKVAEGERLIAVHADINDLEQTINVITVQVNKIGRETQERLMNAEFTKFDSEGNVVEVKWTNEEGIVEFKLFEGETADFKETDAPEGYQLSDEVIRITGSKDIDGNLYTIEYYNDLLPVIELPATGMNNTMLPFALLVIFLGLSLLLGVKLRNKKDDNTVILSNLGSTNTYANQSVSIDKTEHGSSSMLKQKSESEDTNDNETRNQPQEE